MNKQHRNWSHRPTDGLYFIYAHKHPNFYYKYKGKRIIVRWSSNVSYYQQIKTI